jgi:hypothetical protein
MPRHFCFLTCFLIISLSLQAQTDSLNRVNYTGRKILLVSSASALTSISLIGLNQAWYSQYNTGKFHFFNDNGEWLQMDKAGHAFTTYQTSRLMFQAFDWAGYSRKQSMIAGAGISLAYMTAIEIMDGYSAGWGFSWGDEAADVLGVAMVISQEACWKEQRVQLKFSYSNSGLAKYNPSLLGEDKYSRLLKDYNGQTLWLSINPVSFFKKKCAFPSWLNIAVGYGAYGMLGGHQNPPVIFDETGNIIVTQRVRQYYLSLDVDLTRIKTKSKILKGVFSVVNILKFPAPTLELSGKKLRFHPLFY